MKLWWSLRKRKGKKGKKDELLHCASSRILSRTEQMDVFFADSCNWYVRLSRLHCSCNQYYNYFQRDSLPLNADVLHMTGYAYMSTILTEMRRKVDRLRCFVWLLCFRCLASVLYVWYSLFHIIMLVSFGLENQVYFLFKKRDDKYYFNLSKQSQY